MKITKIILDGYREHLRNEEKSRATIEKYLNDVRRFAEWAGGEITKEKVLEYKEKLQETHLPASVNSYISSLNSFFEFAGEAELKVKTLRIQRRIFARTERELSKAEYARLLAAAEKSGNRRLFLLMQTICSSGIRVSELKFITVRAISTGVAEINCKGKQRRVFLPKNLCRELSKYVKKEKIKSGSVFVSKNGNPLDRSNIWSEMKKLCEKANVESGKVFPHNLRHLFARTYYAIQKDIVRLSDLLGHSSVNTTRIYTMESGEVHRRQIQNLGLLRC